MEQPTLRQACDGLLCIFNELAADGFEVDDPRVDAARQAMAATEDQADDERRQAERSYCTGMATEYLQIGNAVSTVDDSQRRIRAAEAQRDELLSLLKQAAARVDLAHSAGENILRAWLPDAKATIERVEYPA